MGRALIYIVVMDGRPVLRIAYNDEVKDYWLTDEQAKAINAGLATWIATKR